MIQITGGIYKEVCSEPYWNELYGSGLRAAIGLSNFLKKIVLYSYSSDKYREYFKHLSDVYPIDIIIKVIPQNITFRYIHDIESIGPIPWFDEIEINPPFQIDGNVILKYGLVEGDAVIKGNYVVYDPQSDDYAIDFYSNGSTASNLAIVANYKEASHLTGKKRIDSIGKDLLKNHDCKVAVIKNGCFGAHIFYKKSSRYINCYYTDKLWLIGSGDIFSAFFCYYWAHQRKTPYKSAQLASFTTAFYCYTRILPIPKEIKIELHKLNLKSKIHNRKINKTVYLAGPFFTMAERWLIEEIRKVFLNLNIKVFSPFHDVGFGHVDHIVELDIDGLEKSDIMFAVVSGLDSGTLFEVGYFSKLKKPIIAFAQNVKPEDLTMLEGTNCIIEDDFTTAIYKTIWKLIYK